MVTAAHELASVRAMLARMHDAKPRELLLQRQPLRGGLEAASVTRVAARYRDRLGRPRVFPLVVKRLADAGAREALVYERFVGPHASGLAPRLLASEVPSAERVVLYLEALRPRRRWPWRETQATQTVLRQVARLHATRPSADALAALTAWDYEAELQAMAERTLEHLERARRQAALAHAGFGPARRVIRALPGLRRQLLASGLLPTGVIHGDLHPGNVVLRRRGGRDEPVLLDWGRARIGSPLEDVCCWLQSLGSWEPEARRRHDTLLASYLAARGLEPRLGPELRAAYWLAGASNALAGALLYHLAVVMNEQLTAARRSRGLYAAREWLRVLRRADAFWS
jgi:Ser/Thr protein kinase RdoA (MazF antagonist)